MFPDSHHTDPGMRVWNKTELVTSFLPSASVLHVFTFIGFACRISKSLEAARQSQSKSQPLPIVHEGQQNRPNYQSKQTQLSVKTDPTISQNRPNYQYKQAQLSVKTGPTISQNRPISQDSVRTRERKCLLSSSGNKGIGKTL